MPKSREEIAGDIRKKLRDAATFIRRYKEQHNVNSPALDSLAFGVEDVAIDFERFINTLPAEDRP